MGSIPLPALDIKPPQQIDLLGQYAKIQEIRAQQQQQAYQQQQMAYQQQMQPLQLQQQQNLVTQQQLQMKSQQAIAQAYIDSDGDLNQTMVRARRAGALPNDLLGLQQHAIQMQQELATKTKTELENISTQHDNLRGIMDPIVAADPAKQPQLWASAKQNILNDPNRATKYGVTDPSQIPDYQSPQQVELYDAALKGGKQSVEDELKAAQTFEATQRGKELQLQQQYGGTPAVEDARYTALKQQQNMGQTLSPQDQAFTQAYEQRKLLVPQYKIENRPGPQGTWSMVEGPQGQPLQMNTVTGEVRATPEGVQKVGTYARTTGPAQEAINYARSYVSGGKPTGPGDEGLMEKFFELAKPSTGFRMTQAQVDMLKNAQSWMGSFEAKARHATTGTWFSTTQRQQIVDTMDALAAAKGVSAGAGAGAGAGAPGAGGTTGGNWGAQFGGVKR